MDTVICTSSLTKYYGKSRGIVDLDLSIPRGDVFGFIGPNGAGKSTTIRLLLGLIGATRGEAQVLGLDCWKDRTAIARRIGYMPSEAMFYSGMRGEDVIAFAARMHQRDCGPEARRLCERFDVDVKKRVEELSLGNRRKLSIICAMQHSPELLILDEPTSGLDPLMQKAFFDLLREQNEAGVTVFLSSHVLSVIQRHCRHAGIVREGRLIAQDSVETLTRSTARRVHLAGTVDAPRLSGLRDVRPGMDGVSFLYAGEMRALIHALDGLPLTDVTITEPDLEEIFLHYYSGEENRNDAAEA